MFGTPCYGVYFNSAFSGNVNANTVLTATVAVTNAMAGVDSVVVLAPASINVNLITWGTVTADGTVTMHQYNPTGGAIASVNVKAYLKRADNIP
jgi:hypothetical protein